MTTSYSFPTPIWIYDFQSKAEHNELTKLSQLALKEADEAGVGVKKSNRGNSFHTVENFLGEYPKSPLHKMLTPHIAHALKDYGYDPTYIVSVGYWSIISFEGAYNERHHHPNSLLSGAFYVDAPHGSGALVFTEPRYGKLMENRAGRDENAMIHKHQRIIPTTGRLVIFPSYLEHQVELTTSVEPRIIYSFNVQMIKPTKP